MIERFKGDRGRRNTCDIVRKSRLVDRDEGLTNAIYEKGNIKGLSKGESLISEGDADDSVYIILAGRLAVLVKGSKIGERAVGDVVGETSAIDPAQHRSATLVALDNCVVLELSGGDFVEIADEFPAIWKSLAIDLSRRLVLRNGLVSAVNEEVNVFIICSAEALDVGRHIQLGLSHEKMLVTLWTNGVFIASHYPLESLEDALQHADFAIAVAHPDDQTVVRGENKRTPRDNVIFELGFFMGRLGRRRTIIVEPRGESVKLPSDLTGITAIGYRPGPESKLPSLLAPACIEIKKIIDDLGPRQ